MTLIQMIERAMSIKPERGITYVLPDGDRVRQSYTDLYRQAACVWQQLRSRGVGRGDAVIVQLPSSQGQIELFWACVLGGAIPVLLPQVVGWVRDSEHKRKLLAIWEMLGKPVIAIEDKQEEIYAGLDRDAVMPGVRVVDVGALRSTVDMPRCEQPMAAASLEDLAFLQFSSGSTGMPKGVRLTHRNIWSNVRDIVAASHMDERDVFLSWMPYFHDMGIIGMHLVPLFLGVDQVKMEAASFALNPRKWLEEIASHSASIVSCPNFGLELVVNRVGETELSSLDLSSIRLLFNGAEPIQAETMRAFMAKLACAGFKAGAMYPVYGMAEASLAVTFGPPGRLPVTHVLSRSALIAEGVARPASANEVAVEYVDLGMPLPSIGLRIRDEQGLVCEDGRMGEIEIRGENVTDGYIGLGNVNAQAFTDDGWLRTGDLGFLRDGRLTVAGRLKELIIIHGRKVIANDVEEAVARLFDLPNATVCACPTALSAGQKEGLALFIAVRKRADRAEWLARIQDGASQYLGFHIDHVIPIAAVPKTSSGKKQRVKLAQMLRDGVFATEVAELLAWRQATLTDAGPLDETSSLIREKWAEVLHVPSPDIALDRPFMALGGDSVKAVRLLSLLESAFGHEFGYDLLMSCHTIGETARYVKARMVVEPASAVSGDVRRLPPAYEVSGKVAIIGYAHKFPGASGSNALWQLIAEGRQSIKQVDDSRWPGGDALWYMGVLEQVEMFDAAFFGIADSEAKWMDPQQRLTLEVAYEALEHAGYTGGRMPAARQVGVYVGASNNGYIDRVVAALKAGGHEPGPPPGLMAGNLINMIAARVAHHLDLKGPALTVDTACSSSLVALRLASEALLQGDCTMALAGGVNLMVTPTAHEWFRLAGALSPDGCCRPFDASANGMVPGEGLGVVVLKRLDKALADGDRIEAVIEGLEVNNDGKSIGIMAPNPQGQEALLRQTYAKAGVSPAQVDYIETHGTGTPLGDPIEFRSLGRVFKAQATSSPASAPTSAPHCALGSVKSNIGHLLAAAGIAGVIKVLLALKHGRIPPLANFHQANPMVPLNGSPFYMPTVLQDWPARDRPRYAAVSAFGFGGTNAHVVLSDAHVLRDPSGARRAGWQLLGLSARSDAELREMAARLSDFLLAHPDADLASLCHTVNLGRERFAQRQAFVVRSTQTLQESLRRFADDTDLVPGPALRKVALFLGGDAPAVLSLCRSLAVSIAAVRQGLGEVLAAVQHALPEAGGIRRLLLAGSLDGMQVAPDIEVGAAFVAEYVLARCLLDMGMRPAMLLAHGRGRIVAACLAQVCTVAAGVRIAMGQSGDEAGRGSAHGDDAKHEVMGGGLQAPRLPLYWMDRPNAPSDQAWLPSHWADSFEGSSAAFFHEVRDAIAAAGVDAVVSLGDDVGSDASSEANVAAKAWSSVFADVPDALRWWCAGRLDRHFMALVGQLWRSGLSMDLAALSNGESAILALPTYPFNRRSHWV